MKQGHAPDAIHQTRAVAVVLQGTKVLLHRSPGDAFWALPGGRVHGQESPADAVVREMREELGEAVACGTLLWTHEHRFEHLGRRYRERGLYFQVVLSTGSRLIGMSGPFAGIESDKGLLFQWFNCDALPAVRPVDVVERLLGLIGPCMSLPAPSAPV